MKAIQSLALAIVATGLASLPALAHTQWGDGSPVSERVKQRCCGDAEVHFLPRVPCTRSPTAGTSTDFRSPFRTGRNCQVPMATSGDSGEIIFTMASRLSAANPRCNAYF